MTASDSWQADKALDLFQFPQTWHQICSRFASSQIEIEVGSGKGLFLKSAASRCPHVHFIGVELSAKFANKAAERSSRAGLANVSMLRGDAKQFLEKVVPSRSVQKVHVYFPDPWWRNKHKKRRVLNEQTIADIQRILIPGGEFHFWTDVLDYYEHICGQVMAQTALRGPRYVPEQSAEHHMDYTTHFERRARLNSQPVYRAIFQKSEACDNLQ